MRTCDCSIPFHSDLQVAAYFSTSTRFTYNTESQNMPAAELCVHLPSRCWTNHSWEQTCPSVLSGIQYRLSGTRCHKQFSSVILCLFLNPDLKLFCSIRLLLNTDPTCRQRLWSYVGRRHLAMLLSDVCLLRILGLTQEQRGLGRLKLAEVAHVTRDWDTTFKVKSSKINLLLMS